MHITTKLPLAFAAFSMAPTLASAEEPAQNINRSLHGNLAAAQDLIRQAFDRISAAQTANDSELGGHAGKAKALLQQASAELKLAADVANSRR